MLKITMNNGSEYAIKEFNQIKEFLDKYSDNNGNLHNKLVFLKEDVGINLSQISSIEASKYIGDLDTIIP